MLEVYMIKNIYDGAKTQVRTWRGDSEHFLVKMGLYLGFTFTPFLFTLVMDELMKHDQDSVIVYVISR